MRAQNYFRKGLRIVWRLVRLPAFTLLVILAPVVRFLLGSLALLGVLMALFWKLVGRHTFHLFPCWPCPQVADWPSPATTQSYAS
jgi:hypothetical protein